MTKICPLTHGACIGEPCLSYSTRIEDKGTPDASAYMDIAQNLEKMFKHVPTCKLFGDLPKEDSNG